MGINRGELPGGDARTARAHSLTMKLDQVHLLPVNESAGSLNDRDDSPSSCSTHKGLDFGAAPLACLRYTHFRISTADDQVVAAIRCNDNRNRGNTDTA